MTEQRAANPMQALKSPSRRRCFYLGVVFLFWLLIYVPGMFRRGLLDDADSVHAEVAREMVTSGDWVTLHADGIRYLEKAPLMYWAVAASFRLFGVSEWAARLPLALGMLALLGAAYSLGRRSFNEEAGFYAALILVTSFGAYVFTRFLIPDILVALFLTLSLDFFLRGLEEPVASRGAAWGLAAATALNVLTKGLIGLVFPAGIILLYLLITGNLRHLARMRLVSSTIVFLAIAAPWHILAALRNPPQPPAKGFLWFYFVNEHFLRYLNERIPRDYGTVPLLVFWGLLLLWIFPWSVFLPEAAAAVPHRWRELRGRLGAEAQRYLLFALWAVFIPFFFSFSTRQEYYTLPAVPALALLVGGWLGRESSLDARGGLAQAARASSAALVALGVAGFLLAAGLALHSKPLPPGADFADLLSKNPKEYFLSFGHIFDLTPQALGALRGLLWASGLAVLAGTALNWIFRRKRALLAANLTLAGMMLVLLNCSHRALQMFEPVLSSKRLALAIEKVYRPGEIIVINGEYEGGSTLNFYTGAQVHILNGRGADLWYGSLFPDAPRIFESQASFARLWAGPTRVFLWTEEDKRQEALQGIDPKTVYELARSGGKLILTNRPAG